MDNQEVATTEGTESAPPAVAENTDKQPVMIPKERFDEVNTKLRAIEKAAAQAAKDASEREAQQLAEQGKFKELYETAQRDLQQAQTAAKAAELARLKTEVAHKHQLPAALIDRLRGETAEELDADAALLLSVIPKPATANDAAAGVNGKAPTPQKSDREIQEMAARLGVSFEHLKRQFIK